MRNLLIITLFMCSLGLSAQTPKEMRDSLSAASEALAYHPDSVDLRLKKAGWNLQLGQWDYACTEYDYILKRNPKNITALFFRAYANEKLGKYKFARLDYENLLAIVPGHFEGRLGLALLNHKDKRYTAALDMLNSLCSQFPDKAEAFAARAGVEQERGMLELAEYDFGEALKLDSHNPDYRLSRIDVRLRLGRKAEARADLDDLVRQGIARPSLEEWYLKTKK